jgi:hypothetical protein
VLSHASWARLESALEVTTGYLGYDRVMAKTDSRHSVVIWSGVPGESEALA